MPFCPNCGHEIDRNAKFCFECGAPLKEQTTASESQRKTTYEGEIHKCPSCGEVLESFTANCPACGFEIRGARASESVRDFVLKLENATSVKQQEMIIRNFPVPNTKEDIFEFMILASTNISKEIPSEIFNAWITKFEQCYHKARLVFGTDNDFTRIQNIYEEVNKQIKKEQIIRNTKKVGSIMSQYSPVLPQILAVLGWLISIFVLIPLSGTNLDGVGTNSYQLILILDFIAGAIFIPLVLRCNSSLPKIISVVGLIISIIILVPLCGKNLDVVGTNAYQLILIVDIISSVIILVRMFRKTNK